MSPLQAAYVIHIFPSCDFANVNLARANPDLLHSVADIAHLVIVITTTTNCPSPTPANQQPRQPQPLAY